MIDPSAKMPPQLRFEGNGQPLPGLDKAPAAGKPGAGVGNAAGNVPPAPAPGPKGNDLVPGAGNNVGDLRAAGEAAGNAANKLGNPAFDFSAVVDNIAKFLARAMIENAGEQRQNALNDRLAARESAKAELVSQADKMEKAADKMATGAIVNLVAGVIGGAMSIGGSAFSAVKGMSQIKEMKGLVGEMKGKDISAQSFKTAETQFGGVNSQMQLTAAKSQIVASSGDMTKMLGSSSDARLQAEAKREDAGGARDAADAQVAQQQAELSKDTQDTMNEMVKQIINFLKELKDAEVDAMRALTRV